MKLDELFLELQPTTDIVRREPQEKLPRHVVMVEDEETGTISYMTLFPDGHLGAIDA